MMIIIIISKLGGSKIESYILVLYDIIVKICSSNSICKVINKGINQYHPYVS